MITSTEIMEFIQDGNPFMHRLHVVKDGEFSGFCACIRQMTRILNGVEDDRSATLARRLGGGLIRMQLNPLPLNQAEIIDTLLEFEDPHHLESVWGVEFRISWERALSIVDGLVKEGGVNPLRGKFREVIKDCRNNGERFRILCSRHHRDDFIEMLEEECPGLGTEGVLFQRETEYREILPFDRLIRVGPMKSRGLARVPDSVFNAPRFRVLEQIRWDVSRDDDDIGMEPVGEWQSRVEQGLKKRELVTHGIQWHVELCEVNVERPEPETDNEEGLAVEEQDIEFSLFGNRGHKQLQKALLFEVSAHGFSFQRPGTGEWSLAVDGKPLFRKRLLRDIREGMFIALYRGNEAHGLLGQHELQGDHAVEWKSWLRDRMKTDHDGLVRGLRQSGISVENLEAALDRWCRRGVVPAPKRRSDFLILLQTLDLRNDPEWFDAAWEEIQVVRGDRMQQGMLAHDLVDEALGRVVEANGLAGTMVQHLQDFSEKPFFFERLPEGGDLEGRIDLYRVHGVEDGFRVPANLFDRNLTPEDIEQWRE